MENIEIRIDALTRSLTNLKKMLDILEDARRNEKNAEKILGFQDSLIQRFEICFELTWKLLKAFLFEKYGIDVASPKKVYQEFFKQKMINEDEVRVLLQMVDDRNTVAHIYSEITARKISDRIEQYYGLINKISKQVQSAT